MVGITFSGIAAKMSDCSGKTGSWMNSIKLDIGAKQSPRMIQFISIKRKFCNESSEATLNDGDVNK